MFGIILAGAGFVLLALLTIREQRLGRLHVVWTLHGAYALRLVLQSFVRDLPLFSHGAGTGDYLSYEGGGRLIATLWSYTGVHYVSAEELPAAVTDSSLPYNVFAFVIYMNGQEVTRIGCTAVAALAICLTCYNLYRFSLELGADEPFAFRVLLLTLFGPAVLMYTADVYKDGLVLLFTTGAVVSAIRLSQRFSVIQLLIGIACLFCLWLVRFYLVFLSLPPLVVGFSGLRSGSPWRPLVVTVLLVAASLGALASSNMLSSAQERMSGTFSHATSSTVREGNAGGSTVEFDDGGRAFGAFDQKLVYTLFSPFPWQGGSLGFQVGKLDAFIWYFLVYRAWKAGRRLFWERPTLLLMFLSFLIPTTVAYAATMANVGLIVRQRLPIVLMTAVLAALSEPSTARAKDEDLEGEVEENAVSALV
jgi:hypothetical protein